MAGAKNHDYHILPPDAVPIVSAFSALLMAAGGIMWMHGGHVGKPNGGGWVFLMGLTAVLACFYVWWAKVINEAHRGDHTPVVQLHLRYGMILFIASEVMFFVAWFWAYFDVALFPSDAQQFARTNLIGAQWPPAPSADGVKFRGTFDPWHLPLLNTLILLTSGTTVTWAHHALLHGDRKGLINGLWITIILGALFTCVQAYEYAHAAFTFSGHIYGATFFMATGFHGAHVLIGTTFLIVCLFRAYAGHFTPTQHLGFEFAAWYWHFVDVVWLFLFVTIYVWGYGGIVAGAAAH